jgi:hypothetical protein
MTNTNSKPTATHEITRTRLHKHKIYSISAGNDRQHGVARRRSWRVSNTAIVERQQLSGILGKVFA